MIALPLPDNADKCPNIRGLCGINQPSFSANVGESIAVNPAKCPKRTIVQNASHLLVASRGCQISVSNSLMSRSASLVTAKGKQSGTLQQLTGW
jgi:hypothetical protein